MQNLKSLASVIFIVLSLMTFLTSSAFGDASDASVLFLRIVNDPGAVAMGNCVVNNINAQSALYNPGAIGLFYLDKNFSFSLPNNSMWLKEVTNNLRYKTFSIGGGISLKQLNKSFYDKFNASLSIAYSRQKITYGEIAVTDPYGEFLGYDYPYEKASYYTIGLGFEFYARIGVGYTIKKIHSDLGSILLGSMGKAKAEAHDIGIIADIPFGEILPLKIPVGENKAHSINFDLTPSYAYVKANGGDDINYSNSSQSDPLPEIKRKGYAVYGGVNLDQSSIISFRSASEHEEDLVTEDSEDIEKNGSEIGFFGIFYYRWGKYEDSYGHIDIKTSGYAINLKNIIKWFDTIGPGYDKKTERYITDHFDFIFEYASYNDDEDDALSNTTFLKISFSI